VLDGGSAAGGDRVIGPVVLFVIGIIGGALSGGPAGAFGGALLAGIVTAMVAASAAVWARQIGTHLDRTAAREHAPCLPGFGRICGYVYDRVL